MTPLVIAMQAADGDVRLDVLLRSVPSSRRQTLLLASWLQGEVAALTAAAGWWPAQCMSLFFLEMPRVGMLAGSVMEMCCKPHCYSNLPLVLPLLKLQLDGCTARVPEQPCSTLWHFCLTERCC